MKYRAIISYGDYRSGKEIEVRGAFKDIISFIEDLKDSKQIEIKGFNIEPTEKDHMMLYIDCITLIRELSDYDLEYLYAWIKNKIGIIPFSMTKVYEIDTYLWGLRNNEDKLIRFIRAEREARRV